MTVLADTKRAKDITTLFFLSLFLSLFAALICNPVFGQTKQSSSEQEERTSFNEISLELLGKGLLYNINYSRFLGDKFAVNTGLTYFSLSASSAGTSSSIGVFILPITGSLLVGGSNHFFDAEAGIDFVFATGRTSKDGISSSVAGTAIVPLLGASYRYWPMDGGFHFKVGMDFLIAKGFYPWPGLAFGYAF